jgi:hypothetical protein
MERDAFLASMAAAVAEAQRQIATCHERRACPTCRQPIGFRCIRKGQLAGPPLKHPHKARWTQEVPER